MEISFERGRCFRCVAKKLLVAIEYPGGLGNAGPTDTAELLLWRPRHGRRMMIHDHPIRPLLYVGETVSGGQSLGFAVSDEEEGLVPGIDRSAIVDTDRLLSKSNLQPRKRLEGIDKRKGVAPRPTL
jgi:hypothetical protein